MQRICHAQGGIKFYRENPDCLVGPETLECPFCSGRDAHRLRRHGWYLRIALVLALGETIPVRRLLCTKTGSTVSLLPDFCIPGRQHGPDILGVFLYGLVKGMGLLRALRKARPDAPCYSLARSLKDGFLRRKQALLSYLSTLSPRAVKPPEGIPRARRLLAYLVLGLTHGFREAAEAFRHHGYHFHRSFRLALA